MDVQKTEIEGLLIIEPKVFGDDRGFFLETYSQKRYQEAGIPGTFVQDNLSYSRRGVLRGLHFQSPNAQGKLVSCPMGEVFDVAVDIRKSSPTFGKWVGVTCPVTINGNFGFRPDLPTGFWSPVKQPFFHTSVRNTTHPKTKRSFCGMILRSGLSGR